MKTARNPTLSEFEKLFVTLRAADIRPTTLNRIYKPAFVAFRSICGERKISQYTLLDVEAFKSTRMRSCSLTTVNIEFRSLRAAFTKAVEWALLRENPFVKSRPVRVPEKLPSFITKEELQRLLAVVEIPVLKDLFLFAALTGMRQSEILNLMWQNIGLTRRLIYVVNSEGFTTKSGRCRTLPMNDAVFELLSRRSVTQGFCRWVFQRRGKQLTQSFVAHRFKRYIRKVGLNDSLRFHSLRHSHATWLAEAGVGIYEIQRLLGHCDIKVTQVYTHHTVNHLRETVSRIAFDWHALEQLENS